MVEKPEVGWFKIGTVRCWRNPQNVPLRDQLLGELWKVDAAIIQVKVKSTTMRIFPSWKDFLDERYHDIIHEGH
jgi:hypothetical protein